MRLFLDRALDRPTSPSLVDDHFRRLGYRQAARGRNHEVIDGAVAIALSEVWDELRVRAAENELSASALNSLSEALTGFVAHLEGQVRIGFATGSAERDQDQGVARARLLDHLLAGADDDEIETQAALAQWPDRKRAVSGKSATVRVAPRGRRLLNTTTPPPTPNPQPPPHQTP